VTLRDNLRGLAERLRGIPQAMGLRAIRVWIRASVRSRPALLTGGTVTTTDVEITPRPAVVAIDTVDPSYWGAATVGLIQGEAQAEFYQIGPITPPHDGGGYSFGDLVPLTSTTTNASRILLADVDSTGMIGTTPVEFELVTLKGQDKGRSFRWEMLVRRVRANNNDG